MSPLCEKYYYLSFKNTVSEKVLIYKEQNNLKSSLELLESWLLHQSECWLVLWSECLCPFQIH